MLKCISVYLHNNGEIMAVLSDFVIRRQSLHSGKYHVEEGENMGHGNRHKTEKIFFRFSFSVGMLYKTPSPVHEVASNLTKLTEMMSLLLASHWKNISGLSFGGMHFGHDRHCRPS